MSRYDLPVERNEPSKIRLALVTLAFFCGLGVLFFGAVWVLTLALSWMGTLLEAVL